VGMASHDDLCRVGRTMMSDPLQVNRKSQQYNRKVSFHREINHAKKPSKTFVPTQIRINRNESNMIGDSKNSPCPLKVSAGNMRRFHSSIGSSYLRNFSPYSHKPATSTNNDQFLSDKGTLVMVVKDTGKGISEEGL